MSLEDKYNALQAILRDLGKVLVAYSGGVDSTLLLKVAAETLGADNVLACISVGVVQPKGQHEAARKLAREVGVELVAVEPNDLNDPKFTANTPQRCFHCKRNICKALLELAAEKGLDHVVFGTNADDASDFRPGNRALESFGIRSPLAEVGLTKSDIRQLSRQFGLSTAEMPANPCLVSRLEYHLPITEERLHQIDEAERLLRRLGFKECRVRHHNTIARIEVCAQDIAKIIAEPVRTKVLDTLKALGFGFVTVDLQGFRSGSLNESLSEEQKQADPGE
ncbi:MAG: ATP-dependent sacrificial sulfur transferase LarE [Phycisphaerales bacterium]|nr:MAG: ATP-dependent sacrificial sulfur transferase LarE [Phycisphaerales bacterium]